MSKDATENRQARILLVDHDPDHLALCTRWLEGSGYPVDTAASGAEALACLERSRPGLVMSDLVMDGMSGLRLLSELH
jgi:two-component system response regulator GlrR